MKKRILSLVLASVMLFSLFSGLTFTAGAQETCIVTTRDAADMYTYTCAAGDWFAPPDPAAEVSGYTWIGWNTAPIVGETNDAPGTVMFAFEGGCEDMEILEDTVLYAVYCREDTYYTTDPVGRTTFFIEYSVCGNTVSVGYCDTDCPAYLDDLSSAPESSVCGWDWLGWLEAPLDVPTEEFPNSILLAGEEYETAVDVTLYAVYCITAEDKTFYSTTPGASLPDPGIQSAYLTLSDNIDVTFAVEVPEGSTDALMTFTMNGITRTVTDYTEDADGKRLYTFTGITPQCMGDTVTAAFTATKGGETVSDTVAEYSIRQYCENQLERYADDPQFVTLLSDLLTYGAAAQTYTGYKTDALVTAGLDLTPSIFDTIPAAKAVFSGEASENADWCAATLTLRNAPAVRLYFTADSTENLTVTAELNGREQIFTAADFRTADEGKYYVEFTGITATEFDDAVTAAFAVNGEPVGRSISYSVNTYISGTQNVENANLQALVHALYNYGASAKAY